MSLFQTANKTKKLVEEFFEKCGGDIVLSNCYKNKLEFGCTYNTDVEQKILKISKHIEEYPWWVELLD